MLERIQRLWCRTAHTQRMWPIHGRYICAQCLRQHPVAWDRRGAAANAGRARQTNLHGLGMSVSGKVRV
jgi:hypothetical protein